MRTIRIGRGDTEVDLSPDVSVSKLHAELVVTDDGRYYLTDRRSTNGTFLYRPGAPGREERWERIAQCYVNAHDEVMFGEYRIAVSDIVDRAAPAPQPGPHPRPGGGGQRPIARPGQIRRNPQTGEIIKD